MVVMELTPMLKAGDVDGAAVEVHLLPPPVQPILTPVAMLCDRAA